MSADNGYVIQKNNRGMYVVQMYFASDERYPDPNTGQGSRIEFSTLADAVEDYDVNAGPSEYGLTIAGSASRRIDHVLKLDEAHVRKESIKMQSFTRKPFDVEAVQVQITNLDELAQRVGGTVHSEPKGHYIQVPVRRPQSDRQSKAYVGDWLVYHQRGWKVYNNRAFTTTFIQNSGGADISQREAQDIGVTLDRLHKNLFNPREVQADTLQQMKEVVDSDGARRSPR